jgi:hypothetical protein
VNETLTRAGDGPRRRRMIRGTIVRIGDLAMRYGLRSQLATLDCTSSRRSTVMCALPWATGVTTEYQRDSSSKRPRSSVVSAARAPTHRQMPDEGMRPPGLRALRAAPTAPLDPAPATGWEALDASKLTPARTRQATIERRGLDKGSFHIRLVAADPAGKRHIARSAFIVSYRLMSDTRRSSHSSVSSI